MPVKVLRGDGSKVHNNDNFEIIINKNEKKEEKDLNWSVKLKLALSWYPFSRFDNYDLSASSGKKLIS